MTSRSRRDFLLDSGGVSALAANRDLLLAYLDLLEQRFDGALLIPIPVLTEVRSGNRGPDALVDRLIKAIGAEGDIYAPLTVTAAARAGVLRTRALQLSRHDISTTDAQLVATAEERSYTCAVTIVTGDPGDINLLVGLTRRTKHRSRRPRLIKRPQGSVHELTTPVLLPSPRLGRSLVARHGLRIPRAGRKKAAGVVSSLPSDETSDRSHRRIRQRQGIQVARPSHERGRWRT